ncbi:MAG: caspase family protein [Stellaceae bacterium]
MARFFDLFATGTRRVIAIVALILVFGMASPMALSTPAAAEDGALGAIVHTHILAKIYQSANARLSRGDLGGAVAAFNLVADIGPGVTEAQFSKALANVLLHFSAREEFLPTVQSLAARDPGNPLNEVLEVFADPTLSRLRADGALYVAPEGMRKLRDAASRLGNYPPARNGMYIAAWIRSGRQTGNSSYPVRYPGFRHMIGDNGMIRLANWDESVSFGELFILSVNQSQFAPYEARLIARFQNGLRSLQHERPVIMGMERRIEHVQAELRSHNPARRMAAVSDLDRLRVDLKTFLVSYDRTVGQMKIIADNIDARSDARIAQNQRTIREQQKQIALLQRVAHALDAETATKRLALSRMQKEYMRKVALINAAQAKINGTQSRLSVLETRLAEAKGRLASKNAAATGLQQAVEQRNAQLAKIKAREEQLRQQQQAAAKLDGLKEKQADAAATLAQIKAQIETAQAQKHSDLAALEQQQTAMNAKLAALSADVKTDEAARQRADATMQELARLKATKASVESELSAEQTRLASARAESSQMQQQNAAVQTRLAQLQRQMAAVRVQQRAGIAERARLANAMRQIDFGRYYALVIGNDQYENWPRLHTAVNDARSIAQLLTNKYGFQVQLLTNATKTQIMVAINSYVGQLEPTDNLLIYYAGHGVLDHGVGYWVPVNGAMPGSRHDAASYVAHSAIIHALQRMKAKQVMVLADSCFSGGLAAMALAPRAETVAFRLPSSIHTRGMRIVDQEGQVPVAKIQGTVARASHLSHKTFSAVAYWASLPARVVLTSGGLAPVADQLRPGDKHSVFAAAVIRALRDNSGLLKSMELTDEVQEQVVRTSGGALHERGSGTTAMGIQAPTYNNLMGYSGQFLFVARD